MEMDYDQKLALKLSAKQTIREWRSEDRKTEMRDAFRQGLRLSKS